MVCQAATYSSKLKHQHWRFTNFVPILEQRCLEKLKKIKIKESYEITFLQHIIFSD